jgi:DNA-binding transcriptional MerR regulator
MSLKTLRFYDEIGLIKPVGVDPLNRYRYYTMEQLDQVRWIQELKGYGLPLADISKMLLMGNQREVINMVERRLEILKWEKEQLEQTILNMERRLMLLNFEMSQMMKQFLQMTNDLGKSVEEASKNLYHVDKFVTGKFIKIQSDVLMRVLSCEVSDSDYFRHVLERYLLHTRKFFARYPLTSIAIDDPRFDRDFSYNSWSDNKYAYSDSGSTCF